jgi:hypothetical protein
MPTVSARYCRRQQRTDSTPKLSGTGPTFCRQLVPTRDAMTVTRLRRRCGGRAVDRWNGFGMVVPHLRRRCKGDHFRSRRHHDG